MSLLTIFEGQLSYDDKMLSIKEAALTFNLLAEEQ